MGVYIKGMEMPKGCFECPLQHRGFNGSETVHYCYVICKEVSDDGEIDADCPLISVPPHGRLIDADVLMEIIKSNAYMVRHGYNEIEHGMTVYGIQQAIDESKTIIPAEEGEE